MNMNKTIPSFVCESLAFAERLKSDQEKEAGLHAVQRAIIAVATKSKGFQLNNDEVSSANEVASREYTSEHILRFGKRMKLMLGDDFSLDGSNVDEVKEPFKRAVKLQMDKLRASQSIDATHINIVSPNKGTQNGARLGDHMLLRLSGVPCMSKLVSVLDNAATVAPQAADMTASVSGKSSNAIVQMLGETELIKFAEIVQKIEAGGRITQTAKAITFLWKWKAVMDAIFENMKCHGIAITAVTVSAVFVTLFATDGVRSFAESLAK